MKKKIAEKWIKALRSGKYKQGFGKLCTVEGKTAKYCCLGVLCHILGTPYEKRGKCKDYGKVDILPFDVKQQASMISENGKFFELGSTVLLTELNDAGKSFKEIANVIKTHWPEL